MACGFGACYGCVVVGLRGPAPLRGGGAKIIDFCGIELRHRVINASGCFDALARRRVGIFFLFEHFQFAAYVSKTITLAPREGNTAPRL